MKTKRYLVSFIVEGDKALQAVIGIVSDSVSSLRIEEGPTLNGAAAAPLAHKRVDKVRKHPVQRRPLAAVANMSKGERIATSPLGQMILPYVQSRLRASTADVEGLLRRDGRWSPNSASPALSELRRDGFLTKEQDRPGAPYVFVKMPKVIAP